MYEKSANANRLPGKMLKRIADLFIAELYFTNLTACTWIDAFITSFRKTGQTRRFHQIGSVSQEGYDRNSLDSMALCGASQRRQLLRSQRSFAPHTRNGWKIKGVLQVEVHLVVTPFGIFWNPAKKEIHPFHLSGKIPLKSADEFRVVHFRQVQEVSSTVIPKLSILKNIAPLNISNT